MDNLQVLGEQMHKEFLQIYAYTNMAKNKLEVIRQGIGDNAESDTALQIILAIIDRADNHLDNINKIIEGK